MSVLPPNTNIFKSCLKVAKDIISKWTDNITPQVWEWTPEKILNYSYMLVASCFSAKCNYVSETITLDCLCNPTQPHKDTLILIGTHIKGEIRKATFYFNGFEIAVVLNNGEIVYDDLNHCFYEQLTPKKDRWWKK